MADILVAKLTREEFLDLHSLWDNDSPTFPLWTAITTHAIELAPEEFFNRRYFDP